MSDWSSDVISARTKKITLFPASRIGNISNAYAPGYQIWSQLPPFGQTHYNHTVWPCIGPVSAQYAPFGGIGSLPSDQIWLFYCVAWYCMLLNCIWLYCMVCMLFHCIAWYCSYILNSVRFRTDSNSVRKTNLKKFNKIFRTELDSVRKQKTIFKTRKNSKPNPIRFGKK